MLKRVQAALWPAKTIRSASSMGERSAGFFLTIACARLTVADTPGRFCRTQGKGRHSAAV